MRFVLAMTSMFLLTGCATTTATVATNTSACSVWSYWRWSVQDTDDSIRQAKVNNARRTAFCGK